MTARLLRTCWTPSPCGRLSRPPRQVVTPATTTGPPPHPIPTAGNGPAHHRPGWPEEGRHRMVPTFTVVSIVGAVPNVVPATSPRLRRRLRRGLPTGVFKPLRSHPVRVCTAVRPVSARFEPVDLLRDVTRWFLAYTFPTRLPDPDRLAVPIRPGVVGAASRPHPRSQDQAAPSFTGLLRQAGGGVLSPPLDTTAPRGAQNPRSKR